MAHLIPEKKKMNYFDGDFVEVFKSLLHPFSARQMDANGNYTIPIRSVTDEHLLQHLKGEIALAFDVCAKMKSRKALARFIGVDIDQDVRQRLPIYAGMLRQMGLENAAFVTGGSLESKGKIIICFKELVPKHYAHQLAMEIHRMAYEQSFGAIPERPESGNVEIFPFNASDSKGGGVLRVLGRHIHRNGEVETPLGLDGNPLDLIKVKPLSRARLVSIVGKLGYEQTYKDDPPGIAKLLKEPWLRGYGSARNNISHLAHYYAGKHGAAGENIYREKLALAKTANPDLPGPDNPSSSGDRRNPIDEELRSMGAWKDALKSRWLPQSVKDSTPGRRCYEAMCKHVQHCGLFPQAFGMTEKMLAERMGGVHTNAARKQIRSAQKSGLILKLHPGEQMTIGLSHTGTRKLNPGTPAMYALIGEGESLQSVWEKACADEHLLKRYHALPLGPYGDPNAMDFVPCALAWKILPELIIKWNAEAVPIAA